ncbi:MAG: hypothetical protein H6744_02940 [Deltaproteobacteria bacterium]|nr:hypothetical protein [Deltaproteobacteria bacterium]MCB9785630.1 hypothetical protein [Deltaproteobacteria bacterium]
MPICPGCHRETLAHRCPAAGARSRSAALAWWGDHPSARLFVALTGMGLALGFVIAALTL